MKSCIKFFSFCLLLISNQAFSQICDVGLYESNITHTSCSNSDGAIELTFFNDVSNYTFAWSGVNGFTATTNNINNLESGFYIVIVQNTNTGESCGEFFIVKNPFDESCDHVLNHAGCFDDGSILLACTSTTPYSYQWSNGATTPSINGLGAGNYQVTITDADGCFHVKNYVITAPCIDINPDLPNSVLIDFVQADNTNQIQIDIVVSQFESVVSLQYSHQFDPSVLQFQGIGNLKPLPGLSENSFGPVNADAGYITFSWFDTGLDGETLPDGSVLYSLFFTTLNTNTSEFYLSNVPTPLEASNSNFNVIPVIWNPIDIVIEDDGNGNGTCLVNVSTVSDAINVTGLTSDANTKLFDSNSQIMWSCDPWNEACSPTATINSLASGTYFLSVQSTYCNEWIPIEVLGVGEMPTCTDGIQNQGESAVDCGGPCAPCEANSCNISAASENGTIIVTGLTSDANTKLFDADIVSVWECNPWNGSLCNNNEVISNLNTGATYFLSVQSNDCSEWIPIVVTGEETDDGGDMDECNVSMDFENENLLVTGLTSDANTKLFDENFSIVWGCDPWNNSPCIGSVSIPNLDPESTYFLSVVSNVCDLWIPVSNSLPDNTQQSFKAPQPESRLEINEIFPNPTKGQSSIRFESTVDQQIQLDIYDLTGIRKLSKQFPLEKGSNTIAIDVSSMSNGLYNITITNSFQQLKTIRFIKN